MNDLNIRQMTKESLTAFCTARGDGIRAYASVGLSQDTWNKSKMLILGDSEVRGFHDINAKIISVAAHPSCFELAALAGNGTISIATNEGVRFEFIDTAGTGKDRYGYLTSIRYLGESLVVCGDLHQIYRRTGGKWERYDFGLRLDDTRAIGRCLNDIAGTHPESAYTVGDRGVIYRFSGNRWIDCASPVNVNLEQIIIDSSGTFWSCGSNGIIVRGYCDTWEVAIADGHENETFWGICEYGDNIFVCSSLGLYRLEGSDLIAVEVSDFIGQPYRLAADGDYMWLLGFNDLMRFDGKIWTRIAWHSNDKS